MVREFGLSPALGQVGYPQGGSVFLGSGSAMSSRPFAEATQAAIDAEVARLPREAEQQATDLLTRHRAQLDELAELLLKRETVDGTLVYRQGISPANADAYVSTGHGNGVAVAAGPYAVRGASTEVFTALSGGPGPERRRRSRRTASWFNRVASVLVGCVRCGDGGNGSC